MKRPILVFTLQKIILIFVLIILVLLEIAIVSQIIIANKIDTEIIMEPPIIEDVTHDAKEEVNVLKRDPNIPSKLNGHEVVGKLEIPKIDLSTYILSETNTATLKASVTKLYGPDINKEGNFCIIGHNYTGPRMFGKLNKLDIGNSIFLTDLYGQRVEYQIYDIQKVKPNNVEALTQETQGDREVTLITCTPGATKRLIIKGSEIYD